ncbi:hypothetical protein WA026_013386 [Henosepilachna vigintioctopunctata]
MEGLHNFISLDIGTTTIRCLIIDSSTRVLGSAFAKVELLYPEECRVEIDPEWLWDTIISVVKNALYDAKISASEVKSLGISSQRATFITWHKDTNKPFHNFITWKDVRSSNLIEKWNNSMIIKSLRTASYLLYLITRNARYLAGSRLKMGCSHVSSRLLWVLDNIPEIREEIKKHNVMFGTLETWLLYRLTNHKTYVTDISSASATGFFDPFTLEWGSWAINILKIPKEILPPVVENDYNFGSTDYFGAPISISTVLADQTAAMLGSCCFKENTLKITIGTGSFINVNTGSRADCTFDGMYPLVGWKLEGIMTYLTEAPCSDGGSLVEWMKVAGYVKDIADINRIVNGEDVNDLYFIPAFSGLGPPFNDAKAASGFIGIKPTTTSDQMALAVLESITFRVGLAFQALKSDCNRPFKKI